MTASYKNMLTGTGKRWLLPVFITIVVLCLFFMVSRSGSAVTAQTQPQAGTDSGILVIPVQIERDKFGLAMGDTVGQTLWIYELSNRGPAYSRLKLLAARSWKYDRLLQQYNTDEPKPEQVKMLLEGIGPQGKKSVGKQQVTDVNTLEIAEPNDGKSAGQ